MRKSKEIKLEAKEVIRNSRKNVLLVLLAYALIIILVGFVMGFLQGMVEGLVEEQVSLDMSIEEYRQIKSTNELKDQIVDLFFGIINSIIGSLFAYGFFVSFVEIKKQGRIGVFDYFGEGFAKCGKIIMRDLYVGLIAFCWGIVLGLAFTLGAFLTGLLSQSVHPIVGIIVGAAVIVPSIIFVILKLMRYSMALYLLHKDLSLTGVQAVKKSFELLDKEKVKQLLSLELSFIGWYLLYGAIEMAGYTLITMSIFNGASYAVIGLIIIAITVIIEAIHMIPYTQMATICFYDEVMGEGKSEEVPVNEMLV